MLATRTPTLDDAALDALEALLAAAYGRPGWRDEVARIAAIDPEAWVVVEDDGELVGCACGSVWEPIGWIGLVATRPADERRGIGRLATQAVARRLQERCATLALDASAKGQGLYAALGYAACGWVRELAVAEPVADGQRRARLLEPTEALDALLELDRAAFGGERGALLRRLRQEGHPLLVVDGGARPDGYAFVLPRGVIGPAVACDAASAQALVAAAARLVEDGPARIIVPPGSVHLDLLERLGCGETRRLAHMRTGTLEIRGRRELLLGQASYAVG